MKVKSVLMVALLLSLIAAPLAIRAAGHESEAGLLSAIAERSIPEQDLIEAISKLGLPAQEPPQYWSRMANDPTYPNYHRRRAVIELFKRHAHVGMRLSEVRHLLACPTWLRAEDVILIEAIFGGHIPVRLGRGDTVFDLSVLPEAGMGRWVVYLRLTRRVEEEKFRSLLLGAATPDPQTGRAKIAQIGFLGPTAR
jgi:hypothetical protein